LLVPFCSLFVVVVAFLTKSADLFLAAAPELLPVRIVAAIALVAVIVAFVHVLRHLKSIERTIVKDDLVPTERGPRNNVLLMVCAIPIIVVGLLFYLVIKA
jgi:undecaprenyl pyrophosphate phosphatase UppP